MLEKKNYYGIDLLKFIMAVCVVAIHTQPLYSIQSIVVQRLFDTITSLAVPYFFSVSGFLLFSKIDANILSRKSMEVCKKYLSRVLSLYVICNGVQREHNKKLNNGLPILHKVPPKRDYGRYFCIMAEKGGTSHGGLTEKLSPFFHAKKQEVNAYGR